MDDRETNARNTCVPSGFLTRFFCNSLKIAATMKDVKRKCPKKERDEQRAKEMREKRRTESLKKRLKWFGRELSFFSSRLFNHRLRICRKQNKISWASVNVIFSG